MASVRAVDVPYGTRGAAESPYPSGFSCREVARIVRCRQPPWCARSLQPAARWPNRGPEAARRGPSGDGHPAQGGGAPSLRTWRGGDPCPIRTAAGVRCPGARARARTSAQARPAGEPIRQARPPRAPNAQARPPMGPNCVVGRERFAGAALSYWHPHRASGHHPGCASSACRFGPDPRGAALTGFRPSPTSHASLGPVSGQAHAGTHGQSDRPPPPARRWMVTVTRSAYEQVRCAVMALWSEWLPRYAAEDDP